MVGKKKANRCSIGDSCGLTCISKTKICRKVLNEKVNEYLDKKVSENGGVETSAVSLQDFEERIKSLNTKSAEDIKEAEELFDSLPPKVSSAWAEEIMEYKWGYEDSEKVQSFVDDGLSDGEALAMAGWLSLNEYGDINKAIYNPKDLLIEEYLTMRHANRLIKQAASKLPPANKDDMEKLAKEKGIEKWETLPEGRFRRGIQVSAGQAEEILGKYQNVIGKSITEETNFAITNLASSPFMETANVVFEVKAKVDGTGKGIALDKYKGYNYEGEILYPAGQKFNVISAQRAGGPGETLMVIELEEGT